VTVISMVSMKIIVSLLLGKNILELPLVLHMREVYCLEKKVVSIYYVSNKFNISKSRKILFM